MKSILVGIGAATLFSVWGYVDGLVWWQIVPMWIFLFFFVSIIMGAAEYLDKLEAMEADE